MTRTVILLAAGQPHRVLEVRVIVLIDHRLYLVFEDVDRLRAGQVLSRNLELTREVGYDPKNLDSQVFLVYDSLFDARRAFTRINPKYREVEIPEIEDWSGDADWLLRQSWSLDAAVPTTEAQFVLCARDRASKHAHDRNNEKVAARNRTIQVGSIPDTTGRRNIGRIPLLCSAVERGLQRRVQSVRGIGRRMDFRAIVVEHYLDQLRHECFLLRRAAQKVLISKTIFKPGSRKAPEMRTLATRMIEHAIKLGNIRARPFSRTFHHASQELREAGHLLHEASMHRDGSKADQAKVQLAITYRSMCLLEQHWHLEDILVIVSALYHRKLPLGRRQANALSRDLAKILDRLTQPDAVTGELLHAGFQRPDTVEDATMQLHRARLELSDLYTNLKNLYAHLKAACKPL